MRPKELMIGDYLNTSFGIGRVVCIDANTVSLVNDKNEEFDIEYPEEENWMNGILLTSEILEKNGLKPDTVEDAYKYCYKKDDVSIVECYANTGGRFRGIFSFGETRLRITIQFVHQLQNALRLCGIEKEIEL